MTPNCHVCHRENARHMLQSPLEKFTQAMGRTVGVDYYLCNHCSALFQYPIFNEAEYQQFYEKVQRSDSVGYQSETVPKRHLEKKLRDTDFKWRQLQLLDVEGMLPGKQVFEIGPAEGTLLASFRDRGYTVAGIEPLASYARYAREVFHLDVADGYFDAEVAAKHKADLVILDNVLEHLTTPYQMLRLIRGMMNPNGLLYVGVPSAETPSPEDANISHIVLWSRRALAFALTCAGFQPLAILKGRPAAGPHEWVCVSMACLEPRDIDQQTPTIFPSLAFDELSAKWHDMLFRYDRAKQRREKYGPAYPVLVRAVRALRGAQSFVRKLV